MEQNKDLNMEYFDQDKSFDFKEYIISEKEDSPRIV